MRTEYEPGASWTRYVPVELVTTDFTARPSRMKVSLTPAAGFEHGTPASQTGVIGPRDTVPKRPESTAASTTATAQG